jgi:hypothetical protein
VPNSLAMIVEAGKIKGSRLRDTARLSVCFRPKAGIVDNYSVLIAIFCRSDTEAIDFVLAAVEDCKNQTKRGSIHEE